MEDYVALNGGAHLSDIEVNKKSTIEILFQHHGFTKTLTIHFQFLRKGVVRQNSTYTGIIARNARVKFVESYEEHKYRE